MFPQFVWGSPSSLVTYQIMVNAALTPRLAVDKENPSAWRAGGGSVLRAVLQLWLQQWLQQCPLLSCFQQKKTLSQEA